MPENLKHWTYYRRKEARAINVKTSCAVPRRWLNKFIVGKARFYWIEKQKTVTVTTKEQDLIR